jgi:sugar/nucleoside kinase (ribokinase family)
MRSLNGIISADTCKGQIITNSQVLKLIDYLFVADEDGQDIDFLRKHIKGHIIYHSPGYSKIYRKSTEETHLVPAELLVKNANVLGAGDMFASSFLYAIHKKWTMRGAVEYAHNKTAELIRKYNEEV